jgi:hypothetical protein
MQIILRHARAVLVHTPEVELCGGVLLGRFTEPLRRLGIILRDALAIEIHEAQIELGFSVSLFCLLPQLLGFYAGRQRWHYPIISSAYTS